MSIQKLMFVELEFPNGWVRVHTGIGNRTYNGNSYQGIGALGKIGAVKENAGESANRITLSLVINDATLINEVMGLDPIGNDCMIHLVDLDVNRQISTGHLIFDGEMVDFQLKKGKPALINVICSDWMERWASPANNVRCTDAAQQALYPGDQFFNQVEVLAGAPISSVPVGTGGRGSEPRDGRGHGR
ncbi:MAG: hypothetical protein COB35_05045 [Gammaproteobacteria bacterium]|nr:MAG: hypothetical protein COB35_05045 [Gammaproteobacteria bacterium]